MNYETPCQWPLPTARRMADLVHQEVRSMVANSRLVRKPEGIALVTREDLHIGGLLGSGAFSEVHEVCLVGDDPDDKRCRCAMKHLKMRLMHQPDNFRLAAAELAVEAHMLASFDHPNIIKVRGWAANGVASFAQGRHDSFFLLLERLDETLDQRISRWQQLENYFKSQRAADGPHNPNFVSDLWRRFSSGAPDHDGGPHDQTVEDQRNFEIEYQEEQLYLEKLGVCTEIASALGYLHETGVIFRDLKPNNIGFLDGRVKLFDFGLSRELPSPILDEPFEMSGKVGTLRYMAVEVACHQPYNVSADVYSWAMVCYEVVTLQKPFQGWTRDMHASLVCGRGVRPDLQGQNGASRPIPTALRPLLEAAWSQFPYRRPSMQTVCIKMRQLEEDQLFRVQDLLRENNVEEATTSPWCSSCHRTFPCLAERRLLATIPHYLRRLLDPPCLFRMKASTKASSKSCILRRRKNAGVYSFIKCFPSQNKLGD